MYYLSGFFHKMDKPVKYQTVGGGPISKKSALNIRFHNPNTPAETADYIAAVFIEIGSLRLQKVIQEQKSLSSNTTENQEDQSAS